MDAANDGPHGWRGWRFDQTSRHSDHERGGLQQRWGDQPGGQSGRGARTARGGADYRTCCFNQRRGARKRRPIVVVCLDVDNSFSADGQGLAHPRRRRTAQSPASVGPNQLWIDALQLFDQARASGGLHRCTPETPDTGLRLFAALARRVGGAEKLHQLCMSPLKGVIRRSRIVPEGVLIQAQRPRLVLLTPAVKPSHHPKTLAFRKNKLPRLAAARPPFRGIDEVSARESVRPGNHEHRLPTPPAHVKQKMPVRCCF